MMPRRPLRSPRRQRGLTLAELVAVTLVLAITATAAVMNGATVDEARVQAGAAGVARAARFARDESLRTGAPHGVEMDVAGNRVRVFRVYTGAVPHTAVFDVRDPLSKKLWVLDLAGDPGLAGVSLVHAPTWRGACAAADRIVFRDAATPACLDPAGVLLDASLATVSRGAMDRQVKVEGFVARVVVE